MCFKLLASFLSLTLALPAIAGEDKRPELPGGIYDKPYIKRMGKNVAIGGYLDHEFEWTEGKDSTFDQHRFIPLSTRKSPTDFTFHAKSNLNTAASSKAAATPMAKSNSNTPSWTSPLQKPSAIGRCHPLPLGRFNLLHDTPLNDLTERPTVNRQIMPSTLAEAGMGFFGTFYPSEISVATYEIYLVNGFNEKVNSGGKLRIRSGRGSQKSDNNHDKALVGRFGFSPRLGIDLGASFHTGKYDDAGNNRLSIFGADAQFTQGPIELQGEYGQATADGFNGDQRGAYAQTNFHFGHDYFLSESVFTAVARWDWVDFDTSITGDSEYGITFGLNFRPVEDTVFKLDYNTTYKTPANGDKGDGTGRLFFSIASYF